MTPAQPSPCKSCQKRVEAHELRPVGDSFFCETCFSTLMAKPSVQPPASRPLTLKSTEDVKKVSCFICKTALTGTPYKSMGAIAFCENCVGDLTSFKAPETIHEPQRRIKPKPEPEVEPYYSRATQPPAQPTFGEFGEKRCSQCQRRVLEPNGYELHGDDVWCPICLRENPPAPEPAEEVTPEAQQEPADAPRTLPAPAVTEPRLMAPQAVQDKPTWLSCDSCAKSLPSSEFSLCEGFHICPPCQKTDLDAALHLARARHRKQMISLLDELNKD